MDDALLKDLDRAARPLQLTRSAAIREAVRAWLRAREIERFERSWIRAADGDDDGGRDAEAFLTAQAWSNE